MKNVVRLHAVRGFKTSMVVVDIQFKSLKDRNLLSATVDVVSKEEHAFKVERWYRVIKEKGRCYYAIFPFDYLPRMMVAHLMKKIVIMLMPLHGSVMFRKSYHNLP